MLIPEVRCLKVSLAMRGFSKQVPHQVPASVSFTHIGLWSGHFNSSKSKSLMHLQEVVDVGTVPEVSPCFTAKKFWNKMWSDWKWIWQSTKRELKVGSCIPSVNRNPKRANLIEPLGQKEKFTISNPCWMEESSMKCWWKSQQVMPQKSAESAIQWVLGRTKSREVLINWARCPISGRSVNLLLACWTEVSWSLHPQPDK